MEVSGKVLREVEFRDRLRGYDTDEVDEFLEKVAVGIDALRGRLDELEAALAAQPKAAEPAPAPAAPALDDDAIRKMLVLAQRTADMAVGEARDEAARIVDEARADAEAAVARAEDAARRLRNDAEQELQARVARLGEERDRLERDVRSLSRLVEEERSRLTESLTSTLRFVRESLAIGDETAKRAADPPDEGPRLAPEPSSGWHGEGGGVEEAPPAAAERAEPGPQRPARTERPPGSDAVQTEIPDIEAELSEDAASAVWSAREPGGGHVGTPRPIGAVGEPAGDGEADEALWERWAAGRDLGVVPGPADFGRRPGAHAERDRGWPA